MPNQDKKVLLIILDGYGHSETKDHNAIYLAKKPFIDSLYKKYPHSLVETSGLSVGLPDGIMGNSEVGHLNIGGGRIIKQELTKIADFAKEKGFESLSDVNRLLTNSNGALHIMGLLSDGGVHSHQEHLFLLLEAAARVKSKRPIYIHVMTDGRDTPPKSALGYLADLESAIKKTGVGKIATLGGRFYYMDRDKRWERIQAAYDCMTKPFSSNLAKSATEVIESSYKNGETDEFIKPKQISGGAPVQSGDSFLFFNFRADRAREISSALAIPEFKEFPTAVKIKPSEYVTFTSYDGSFPFQVLFQPSTYSNILGELISRQGFKQLRIAETEKYAHVTYFFNGGKEEPFQGEDRVLVPSPKEVKTYDLKPEMSAKTVTQKLVEKLNAGEYKVVVCNYANSDMVGHTGVEPAAISAVETLDKCLEEVCTLSLAKGYDIFITADHGNSECMVDPKTGAPHTAHTTNPVPLIWLSKNNSSSLKNGKLADIAPTILKVLGWPQPKEMTGIPLF